MTLTEKLKSSFLLGLVGLSLLLPSNASAWGLYYRGSPDFKHNPSYYHVDSKDDLGVDTILEVYTLTRKDDFNVLKQEKVAEYLGKFDVSFNDVQVFWREPIPGCGRGLDSDYDVFVFIRVDDGDCSLYPVRLMIDGR